MTRTNPTRPRQDKSMLIRATSDLHGRLPYIPECEALIIAGDICPITDHTPRRQADFLRGPFMEWCELTPANEILLVPGNHDFIFEDWSKGLVPELHEKVLYMVDHHHTLVDDGPRVFGQPWVPHLQSDAFYKPDVELREKAELIPRDIDILVEHGPPLSYRDGYRLDLVRGEHVGNRWLTEMIRKQEPPLLVCGHIHEGQGTALFEETNIANVSFLDDFYEPTWQHLVVQWNAGVRAIERFDFERLERQELFWDCVAEDDIVERSDD